MKQSQILELLKDKSIVIPKVIFSNYKKLGIDMDEFYVLMFLININGKILYNPKAIGMELGLEELNVLEIISNLEEKKILQVTLEKNTSNVMEEYISLDLFYNKLLSLLINEDSSVSNEETSIFEVFEREFGRTLSPMEYEYIKAWMEDDFSEEILKEALKEAICNGVPKLRYIDSIIYEWRKKGYKTVEDVRNNKQAKKEEKKEIFEYNWLDDKDE